MWAYLALCVAAALFGMSRAECDACIDGGCYRKHRLPEVSEKVMDVDRNKNIIYGGDEYKLSQCELDTGACNATYDIQGITWLTVDQRTGDIYARADDRARTGLYKLDLASKKNILILHEFVMYITYKDKPYFINTGTGIHIIEDGKSHEVTGTEEFQVGMFVVDKNDDIYFRAYIDTKYFIFRLSKGVIDQTVYWNGNDYLLTQDKDNNVIFIHKQTHVVYRVTDGHLTEIGVINDAIYGYYYLETILFDGDNNLIYRHKSDGYIHLTREGDLKCTYSVSQNTTVITETVVTTTPLSIETTTSSTPDESDASHAGHEEKSSCSCQCPELPNITVNVKFNK